MTETNQQERDSVNRSSFPRGDAAMWTQSRHHSFATAGSPPLICVASHKCNVEHNPAPPSYAQSATAGGLLLRPQKQRKNP